VLVLDASTITAMVHTTEERLLAVAEALQRVVAEARRKRAKPPRRRRAAWAGCAASTPPSPSSP
jgi:hypothetical protein